MKNKKLFIIVLVLLLLLGGAFAGYKALGFAMEKYHYLRERLDEIDKYTEENINNYEYNYDWVKENVLVAHAFGEVGSRAYTNCLEAFERNYELGFKVFEVDFDLTSDKVTICSHDEDYWRYITENEDTDAKYDYETFKNTMLFDHYTPLDYMDVVNILNEHPDVYIITDTKYSDELSVYQQFSQIVDYAKEVNPEVLDRIIPQIYTKEMLGYVENVHHFKSIILTLYQMTWEAEDIAKYCVKTGIKYVTVSAGQIEDDNAPVDLWKSLNINVAVHTVNDDNEAKSYLDKGVDMIYTDSLNPADYIKE